MKEAFLTYLPLVSALYLVWIGSIMTTRNLISLTLFKFTPILLGLLMAVPIIAKHLN